MEVHDEVDRPHGVGEKSHQLDVSAPLTSVVVHLCVLYLGGCVEEVHELLYGPIVSLLDARVSEDEEGLTETVGPHCIPAVRPDHTEPHHGSLP